MNYNGNLLPHLPGGGSHNGSPDMRLAASNLSLGSNMGGKNKGSPIIVLKSIINKKASDVGRMHLPRLSVKCVIKIFFIYWIQMKNKKVFQWHMVGPLRAGEFGQIDNFFLIKKCIIFSHF